MKSAVLLFLVGLLAFAVYHLARDVSTTFFGNETAVMQAGHRPHEWCRPVCDYVTLPLEVGNIVTIPMVLRRRRVGVLGAVNVASVPVWILFWVLP